MNVLDLFSGIGGFSLGLERAGMRTVAFCEIEPYCRAVLRKHWPDVPIWKDVRQLTATELGRAGVGPIDVICGGFPCQPFSSASHGCAKGVADDRFLWPEMCRIIDEIQPTWVIGENVTHIDRMALERVASDLESIGYEVGPPLEIPACAVGHDHWRARYWLLGYTNGNGKPRLPVDAEASRLSRSNRFAGRVGTANGIPKGLDAVRALGNAVVPQIPEMIGRAIMSLEQ